MTFQARPSFSRARIVRPEMWSKMTGVWPDYDAYQRRTDREIPVIVLERA